MAQTLLQRTVIDNPFIPDLGGTFPSLPQAIFLTAPVDEILYGGAAGGGKSAGLLAAALQYVEHPGYDALIVRRSYADLEKPGGLIPLSNLWLSGKADYDGHSHRWHFPSGATLSFGHIQNEFSVVQDYQGSAFSFIGFDELTQFAEFMYRYLFSRKRKAAGLPFPTRVRNTSNPGGIGHEWVKQRFITAANGINRMFIPAKLEDNPGLDKEDYEESLSNLDPITRAQLRHGDWDIRPEGNLFKREWFKGRIVPESGQIIKRVRYWDLAATPLGENGNADPDWTVGLLLGMTAERLYFILDVVRFRGTALEVKRRMRQIAIRDGVGVEIKIEQEGGASGKIVAQDIVRDVLAGFAAYAVPPRKGKVERSKPSQAAAERGDIYLVAGEWVDAFLDEICSFGTESDHDDQVDALSGAFEALNAGNREWTARDWGKVFDPSTQAEEVQDVEGMILRRFEGASTE